MSTNTAPIVKVERELRAIALTSVLTLSTFAGLVMALPVVDLWTKVLPTPGKYASIARIVAILLSAMLAYREVRHEYSTHSMEFSDIRSSGRVQVLVGVAVTLLYLSTQGMALRGWADLLHAVEYAALIVLLSFGFTRLAKKAYDFASRGLQTSDRSLILFTGTFFAVLTAVVTGFAILNELVTLLPPIVRSSTVSASLAVVVATMFIGANYTAEFLENNLSTTLGKITKKMDANLARKNVVESGLLPAGFGIVCLVGYLVLDLQLGGKPSDKILVELLAIGLKIGLFAFLTFGLWRLGVSEYERRKLRY